MLAQCWLHIGVEKTGTTSIQSFLAGNRSALRAAGRLYPVTPGSGSHPGLVAFALDDDRVDGARKSRGLVTAQEIADFRDEFVRGLIKEISASGASEIIFSSELLSSRMRSPAELARVQVLCAGIARNTRVVVYLRNQVDFLVSRYTTIIQSGGRDEFRMRGTAFADYAALLDRWAGAFGRENLVIRRFEPADFVDGDLLEDFAVTVGLESTKLVAVPRHNESLDAESLAFLRAVNRRLPRRLSQRMGPLRSAAVSVLQRRLGGTRFVIPEAFAHGIEDHFRMSNERVAAQYLEGRFRPLFPRPTLVGRTDELPARPISPFTMIRIAGFLLVGLVCELFQRRFSPVAAVSAPVAETDEERGQVL